jgi:hypothetical protein
MLVSPYSRPDRLGEEINFAPARNLNLFPPGTVQNISGSKRRIHLWIPNTHNLEMTIQLEKCKNIFAKYI